MQPHQEQITYQQLTTFDNIEILRATNINHSLTRHIHDKFAIGVIEQGIHVSECHGKTWIAPAKQEVRTAGAIGCYIQAPPSYRKPRLCLMNANFGLV